MTDPVPRLESLGSATPSPPRRRSALYRMFIGPRGVRAGWKVFLFSLLFAAEAFCFQLILPKVNPKSPLPPGLAFMNEFFGMLAVLIATAIMAKWIDRKPFGHFGIPGRNAFRSTFWVGAVVGFGALSLPSSPSCMPADGSTTARFSSMARQSW